MSTPVINAIDNVNNSSLNRLFQAVANNPTATDSLLSSNRNIDAVGSNAQAAQGLGDNGGDDDVVRRALCIRTGRDPANFPDTAADIVNNSTFRGEILGDGSLPGLLAGSQPGMAEVASSSALTNEVIASVDGLPLVAGSNTAMQEVAASQTAMQEVATSQTAMQEVAASQAAMQEVATSQTAMQEVATSQTAMQEVADSQPAMQEVAASQTAISIIGSSANEAIAENTVLNSQTATTEFRGSPLRIEFRREYNNSESQGAGTLTNQRVLVTSNNRDGNQSVDARFNNNAGPELSFGTTFITNGVNTTDGSFSSGGFISIDGIVIE